MYKKTNHAQGGNTAYHLLNQEFKPLIYSDFDFINVVFNFIKKISQLLETQFVTDLSFFSTNENSQNIAKLICTNIYFSALGQNFFRYNKQLIQQRY